MAKSFGVDSASLAVVFGWSPGAGAQPRNRCLATGRPTSSGASDRAAFERKSLGVGADGRRATGGRARPASGRIPLFRENPRCSRSADEKRGYIKRGLAAEDRALAADPDYIEALVYKNLLLAYQATLETDTELQASLLHEADTLRNRALELRGPGLP